MLDIETTGISRFTEKITEFGIMKVKNGEVITLEYHHLQLLVNLCNYKLTKYRGQKNIFKLQYGYIISKN